VRTIALSIPTHQSRTAHGAGPHHVRACKMSDKMALLTQACALLLLPFLSSLSLRRCLDVALTQQRSCGRASPPRACVQMIDNGAPNAARWSPLPLLLSSLAVSLSRRDTHAAARSCGRASSPRVLVQARMQQVSHCAMAWHALAHALLHSLSLSRSLALSLSLAHAPAPAHAHAHAHAQATLRCSIAPRREPLSWRFHEVPSLCTLRLGSARMGVLDR